MKKLVTIDAENQWTDPLELGLEGATLIIHGDSLFNGIITVQFTTDDITGWVDDAIFTGSTVERLRGSAEIRVKVGCKTGDFVSGSIEAVLYRGGIA